MSDIIVISKEQLDKLKEMPETVIISKERYSILKELEDSLIKTKEKRREYYLAHADKYKTNYAKNKEKQKD